MPAKIRVKVGNVEVDYEGPESFLDQKLTDLIKKLSELNKQIPDVKEPVDGGRANQQSSNEVGTLVSFLRGKDATTVQNKKFLATAEWLHLRGKKQLKTADVGSALRENQQTRLGNASQCLNSNVSQGYCEKVGNEFFVTDDGREYLG